MIARVAVSELPFSADKIYDYSIPASMTERVCVGVRVMVPFGRGNARREAMVLEISDDSTYKRLKVVESVIDNDAIISERQIALAKFMKARFYCTLYETIKAMLPSGLWLHKKEQLNALGGVEGVISTTRTREKTHKVAVLLITSEEAYEWAVRTRSDAQAEILRYLAYSGESAVEEICYYTGVKPASFKPLEKRGIIALESHEVFRRPKLSELSSVPPIDELSLQQKAAYERLVPLLHSDEAEAALLYGVTGSGKTAVYIKLIDDCLERGKGALVLVPEISLTPQLMAVFIRHFGDNIAVLHSSLSVGERYDEWRRIRSGKAKVVVGTRSAVFAPVHHLGLIVIDEEQENSYVSENAPRYNARDVAKFRCVQHKAMLLLGSATPSIESMYYAKSGRYLLAEMPERYNTRPLPDVIIADMKRELKNGNGSSISSVLYDELKRNIASGEQSILFINRRGASTVVACPECGHTFSCDACSVNLTYHIANRRLMCHYCGHSEAVPSRCPKCGGILKFIGTGTQRVEDELKEMFPGTELLRMDTDTINAANPHEALLKKFESEKIPILIGTQMITKGLNFPNVTLVGVINSDNALYAGDYRAQERTFSLITQVVGRAGRGEKTGRAIIQSFTPQNEVIMFAAEQDYVSFYERESALRRLSKAPPFSEMHCVALSCSDEQLTLLCAQEIAAYLNSVFGNVVGVRVLGPSPAPIKKVNNRYRYRVFAAAENPDSKFRALIASAIIRFSGDSRFRKVSVWGINGGEGM